MSDLVTTARTSGTGSVLALAGELDLSTADRVRSALDALALGPGWRLVLDLSGVTFCDSSGITALVVAHNRARAVNADLVLAGVPDHLVRMLRVVGLDQVFTTDSGADPREA
ncbi:STAS domain-containing protein [Umezawaea beigongshangensis]|uniref:STAS domain-containing protein n=1 Tax=Umezawaea beigongshangensis TaxID=2780383 RepID=UPI0018F12201|nr:STAS domain-containing protein [Umezawaea beigongshangensis]